MFYKNYWHIMGKDVCALVNITFSTGSFPMALAETLIVPIPKVVTLTSLKEFRPISFY